MFFNLLFLCTDHLVFVFEVDGGIGVPPYKADALVEESPEVFEFCLHLGCVAENHGQLAKFRDEADVAVFGNADLVENVAISGVVV